MRVLTTGHRYSQAFLRRRWNTLVTTIPHLLRDVETKDTDELFHKLLDLDLVLGRGLFASAVLIAQNRNKGSENRYAELVAKLNIHEPELGKLVAVRSILQLKNYVSLKRETGSLSIAVFIGQLIRHGVISTTLACEIVGWLINDLDSYHLEVIAVFLSQCLEKFLYERSRMIAAFIEKLSSFANENTTSNRARAIYAELLEAYKKTEFWPIHDPDSRKPKHVTHSISLHCLPDPEYERDSFDHNFRPANEDDLRRERIIKLLQYRYLSRKHREEEISRKYDFEYRIPEKICLSRWDHEVHEILRDPLPGIRITVDKRTIGCFNALLIGPADTPYARGTFQIKIWLPQSYPFKAPVVRFITKIFHPNIDENGRVCAGLSSKNWSAAANIKAVLLTIQSLLQEPDLENPLCQDIARLWIEDNAEAKRLAREYTLDYGTLY